MSDSGGFGKNWKLELRYGRRTTPYSHFTVFAEGRVGQLVDGFEAPDGPAIMAMKCWALSAYEVTGRIHVYDTEPEEPPEVEPYGYGINFTPYAEEDE